MIANIKELLEKAEAVTEHKGNFAPDFLGGSLL